MKWTLKEPHTLFDAVALAFPDNSKNSLKNWIRFGRITVDGRAIYDGKLQIKAGAKLELQSKTVNELPFPLLFSDNDLVVIDKPVGLLSVSTPLEKGRVSAHDHLKKYFRGQKVWPAHRLDRDTSGALAFTLTEEATFLLKKQFENHSAKRTYVALLEGHLDDDEGTWDYPLIEDRNLFVRVARGDEEEAEEAITHYTVLKRLRHHTLLQLRLETGRKNQIRAHSQYVGHPVAGDKKYGAETDPLHRLALHAEMLELIHPITKKPMKFHSPPPKGLV